MWTWRCSSCMTHAQGKNMVRSKPLLLQLLLLTSMRQSDGDFASTQVKSERLARNRSLVMRARLISFYSVCSTIFGQKGVFCARIRRTSSRPVSEVCRFLDYPIFVSYSLVLGSNPASGGLSIKSRSARYLVVC